MVDTLCDSELQASLSTAHLDRVGLSVLVHSLKLYAQHFACRPLVFPKAPFLVRLMWQNNANILLLTAPMTFLVGLPLPLLLYAQSHVSCGPSMKSLTCACSICKPDLFPFISKSVRISYCYLYKVLCCIPL